GPRAGARSPRSGGRWMGLGSGVSGSARGAPGGPDRQATPQLQARSERPAYRCLPGVWVPVRLEQVRAAVVRPEGELRHRVRSVTLVVVDDGGGHVDV